MLCKRCFMIINLRTKGFSFSCSIDPFWGDEDDAVTDSRTDAGTDPNYIWATLSMWAVGQVTLLKGTLATLWRCPGIQQHLPESHPGSFHCPYNFYYDSHAKSANQLALVHMWTSQCCDGSDGSMMTQVQREQEPSCQCYHHASTNSLAMI